MNHFTGATSLALIAYCLVAAQPGIDAAHEAASRSSHFCGFSFSEPPRMARQYSYGDCITAKFGFYIKNNDGTFINLGMGTIDPSYSYCQYNGTAGEETLYLNFPCGHLSLTFAKTVGSVFVSSLYGHYILDPPYSSITTFSNDSGLFEVNSDHYYKCDAKQAIVLTTGDDNFGRRTLFVYDLSLEAFKTTPSSDFSKVEQSCSLDQHLTWWIYALALLTILAIVVGAFFVDRLVRRRISAPSNEVLDM